MAKKEKTEDYLNPKKPLIISGLSAIGIFVFDSFMLGAPAFSIFVLIYVVVYLIPVALFSIRNKAKLKFIVTKMGIYSVMLVFSFGFRAFDLSLAEKRANTVISAVEQYNQDNGHYPTFLNELVPKYLPEIPKPRIAPGIFYYPGAPEDPHLMYTDYPPFGRLSWSFKDKEWISIDD